MKKRVLNFVLSYNWNKIREKRLIADWVPANNHNLCIRCKFENEIGINVQIAREHSSCPVGVRVFWNKIPKATRCHSFILKESLYD